MNAVAHAQFAFQMSTLLQKYLYHHNQYSNTWDSKYLALVAQVIWAFGMNPKIGGSSPSGVETLSVSKKTSTLSREYPFVSRKWMLLPAHISDVNFSTNLDQMWYWYIQSSDYKAGPLVQIK